MLNNDLVQRQQEIGSGYLHSAMQQERGNINNEHNIQEREAHGEVQAVDRGLIGDPTHKGMVHAERDYGEGGERGIMGERLNEGSMVELEVYTDEMNNSKMKQGEENC